MTVATEWTPEAVARAVRIGRIHVWPVPEDVWRRLSGAFARSPGDAYVRTVHKGRQAILNTYNMILFVQD